MPPDGVSRFHSRVALFPSGESSPHIDSKSTSVARSKTFRAFSILSVFSTFKFVAQVGAHASLEARELEQIFQIAPRQIRQK